jgi:hypothetical protein
MSLKASFIGWSITSFIKKNLKASKPVKRLVESYTPIIPAPYNWTSKHVLSGRGSVHIKKIHKIRFLARVYGLYHACRVKLFVLQHIQVLKYSPVLYAPVY